MNVLKNSFTSILALGIIIGIGWVLFLLARILITQFHLLSTEISGILYLTGIYILLITLIVVLTIRRAYQRNDKVVHPEKAFLYNEFINYYIMLRQSLDANKSFNQKFRSDLVLWAGPDIIKAYQLLIRLLDEQKPNHTKTLEQAEKVIFEMRKDLGQNIFGLKTGDLDKLISKSSNPLIEHVETTKIQN